MSKILQSNLVVPGIPDTPENVAKALMNPKKNIINSKMSLKRKKRRKRNK